MTRIGAVHPDMMRRVVAATIRSESQPAAMIRDSALLNNGRIVVKNVSGETIPEYGLMQITVAADEDSLRIVEVERPFSQSHPSSIFLVNHSVEILDGELGTAQTGPVFTVRKDSGTYPAGTRMGWKANSFEATFGCLFVVLGPDYLDENLLRVLTDFSMLHGIVTTAITANLGTAGEVQTSDPTTTHKAKTRKGAIAVNDEVYIWPSKGEWIAAKVC